MILTFGIDESDCELVLKSIMLEFTCELMFILINHDTFYILIQKNPNFVIAIGNCILNSQLNLMFLIFILSQKGSWIVMIDRLFIFLRFTSLSTTPWVLIPLTFHILLLIIGMFLRKITYSSVYQQWQCWYLNFWNEICYVAVPLVIVLKSE